MKYNTLNINARIGEFTRNNRRSLGMSGKVLGNKLNISQQHISRLECGKCIFSLEFILRLLNVFDKSLPEFIVEVFYEDAHEYEFTKRRF